MKDSTCQYCGTKLTAEECIRIAGHCARRTEMRSITEAGQGTVLLRLEKMTLSDCPLGGLWLENELGEGMQISNKDFDILLSEWFHGNF